MEVDHSLPASSHSDAAKEMKKLKQIPLNEFSSILVQERADFDGPKGQSRSPNVKKLKPLYSKKNHSHGSDKVHPSDNSYSGASVESKRNLNNKLGIFNTMDQEQRIEIQNLYSDNSSSNDDQGANGINPFQLQGQEDFQSRAIENKGVEDQLQFE